MLTGLFKDASFGPLLNLHVYFLLAGVFRFAQWLSKRFSSLSTFFSLVSSRAFRDAPHSPFWCRDPKVCLRGSLKCEIWPSTKSTQVYFTRGSLSLWTMLGMEILGHLYFFLLRGFARLEMRYTRDFGVMISYYAYWNF